MPRSSPGSLLGIVATFLNSYFFTIQRNRMVGIGSHLPDPYSSSRHVRNISWPVPCPQKNLRERNRYPGDPKCLLQTSYLHRCPHYSWSLRTIMRTACWKPAQGPLHVRGPSRKAPVLLCCTFKPAIHRLQHITNTPSQPHTHPATDKPHHCPPLYHSASSPPSRPSF